MELNHWVDNAWADGTWVQESWGAIPCTPAPIGTVWAVDSWSDTAWCSGTWENTAIPPQPPASQAAGNLRYLRYAEPLFKLSADDVNRKRRKREEEEIVIL